MKVLETFLTKNPCYKADKKITPIGIILHSVCSPQPSAKVLVHNWNRIGCDNKCAHAFVDGYTGDIYQTLPWDHRGRHSGRNAETGVTANDGYIGIEMCEPAQVKYGRKGALELGEWTKHEKAIEVVKRTYASAVELCAQLCQQFNIDPMKGIYSHSEGFAAGIASNRPDPEHLWKAFELDYNMDGFRMDVAAKLVLLNGSSMLAVVPESESISESIVEIETVSEPIPEPESIPEPEVVPQPEPEPDPVLFKVKIDVENLRIRSGPGTDCAPTGKFTGVGTFSVDKIQNGSGSKLGWGRLANGAGWVSLDYVKVTTRGGE